MGGELRNARTERATIVQRGDDWRAISGREMSGICLRGGVPAK
jgi:hypothetical protein